MFANIVWPPPQLASIPPCYVFLIQISMEMHIYQFVGKVGKHCSRQKNVGEHTPPPPSRGGAYEAT